MEDGLTIGELARRVGVNIEQSETHARQSPKI